MNMPCKKETFTSECGRNVTIVNNYCCCCCKCNGGGTDPEKPEYPEVLEGCEYILPFGVSAKQNFGTASEDTISLLDPFEEILFDPRDGVTFPQRQNTSEETTLITLDVANALDWTIGCWVNMRKPHNPTNSEVPFFWSIGGSNCVAGLQITWIDSDTLNRANVYAYYKKGGGEGGETYKHPLDSNGIYPDEYHHYAITSNGQVYIDGKYVGDAELFNKGENQSTTLTIGSFPSSYYPGRNMYGSSISNFFLKQNVVFTVDQIRQIYEAGPTPYKAKP